MRSSAITDSYTGSGRCVVQREGRSDGDLEKELCFYNEGAKEQVCLSCSNLSLRGKEGKIPIRGRSFGLRSKLADTSHFLPSPLRRRHCSPTSSYTIFCLLLHSEE